MSAEGCEVFHGVEKSFPRCGKRESVDGGPWGGSWGGEEVVEEGFGIEAVTGGVVVGDDAMAEDGAGDGADFFLGGGGVAAEDPLRVGAREVREILCFPWFSAA